MGRKSERVKFNCHESQERASATKGHAECNTERAALPHCRDKSTTISRRCNEDRVRRDTTQEPVVYAYVEKVP